MVTLSFKEHELAIVWTMLINTKDVFFGDTLSSILRKIIVITPEPARKLKKLKFNKWVDMNKLSVKKYKVKA